MGGGWCVSGSYPVANFGNSEPLVCQREHCSFIV
jgi:hypothetical protein